MQNLKFLVTLFFICSALMPAFSAGENERNGYVRVDYNSRHALFFSLHTDNGSYDLTLDPCREQFIHGVTASFDGFVIGFDSERLFGGETLIRDIFLSWFGESIGIEMFYQSFENYYIEDGSLNKKYPGPNEYPDMRIMNSGIILLLFFQAEYLQEYIQPGGGST